jgi:hypothetical protein
MSCSIVNSRWTNRRFYASWLLAPALVILACQEKAKPVPPGPPPPVGQHDTLSQAEQDARLLGKDLVDVLDQVLSYKTSHRGRIPRSLREVGIDSLGPATIRRLSVENDQPMITVIYRQPAGRQVRSCRGGRDVLDESTLSGGAYTLNCTLADGTQSSVHVPPPPVNR